MRCISFFYAGDLFFVAGNGIIIPVAITSMTLQKERFFNMPIKIPNDLPAATTLADENIFVMNERRAFHQDIRSIKIVIINLMPTGSGADLQLMRLLSSTPLQLEMDLIGLSSPSGQAPPNHLSVFYKRFDDVKDSSYDGMIITGAPVEDIPFGEVGFWPELCAVMEWSKHHVYSSFHIGWGALAGLYHHYGIGSYPLAEKLAGVFPHYSPMPRHALMRGFDDIYYAPHYRRTAVRAEDIAAARDLRLLSCSDTAGVHIVSNSSDRKIFVTGHYDDNSAAGEHPAQDAAVNWRSAANLLFTNWINFIIYQDTPYDLSTLNNACLKLQ